MKTCVRCHTSKSFRDFDYDKSRRDLRRPYCKACARAAKRISQLKNAIETMRLRITQYTDEIAFLQANPGVFLNRQQRDEQLLAAGLAGAA